MKRTVRFNLNSKKFGSQTTVEGVHVGDDNSCELIITVTDGNKELKLTSGTTVATMCGTKPDGTVISRSCSIVDNNIVYTLGKQDTAVPGNVLYQVTISSDDGISQSIIATAKFTVAVMNNIYIPIYRLLAEQPSDWLTNYKSYFRLINNKYVAISDSSCPTFLKDTFYFLVNPNYESEDDYEAFYSALVRTENLIGRASDILTELDKKIDYTEAEHIENKVSFFDAEFSDTEKYPTVLAVKKFLDDYYYTFEEIDNFLSDEKTEALKNFGFNVSVGFNKDYIPVVITEAKSYGAGIFTGKTEIITAYIPNYVTRIQSGAFSGCTNLTDVYIDNSSTEIIIDGGAIDSNVQIHYEDDVYFGSYIVKALRSLYIQKADKATTLSGYGITDAYTKSEADNSLSNKADKSTTLAGYGITDAYTKSYTDKLLNNKLDRMGFDTEPTFNSLNYLTSGTVYTALQKKADKSTASELQTEIISLQNSLSELSNMIYANEYAATLIIDDDGTTFSDNNGDVMLADWKLKEA